MEQFAEIKGEDTTESKVQSLKELKKSRRTVMLTIPATGTPGMTIPPLTPPLSDRTSGDVEEFFVPESEECYENVDLSSEASWEDSPPEIPPTPEEVPPPSIETNEGTNGID
jgi:hypothetical protein